MLHHIALWTENPERLRDFYCRYFGGVAGPLYENTGKGFRSYFIRFTGGPSLEIMSRTDVKDRPGKEVLGYCHLAFSTGSQREVIERTDRFREEGFAILSAPRTTGDGYFESVVADPDGNPVELVYDPLDR